MTGLERILFPVDFSERCAAAAPKVAAMAERLGAEVHLLHAMTPREYLLGAPEYKTGGANLYVRHVEEVRRRLDAFDGALFPPARSKRIVAEGDPALRVVEYARDHGIGLIMLPAHGLGGFRRRVLGSVAAEVMRAAPCPVWTCVHPELASALPSRVLAVDDSIHEWAARMAEALGAPLVPASPDPLPGSRPGDLAVVARGNELSLTAARCPIAVIPASSLSA